MESNSKIREYLAALYGVEHAGGVYQALEARIEAMPRPKRPQRYRFGPADAVLITYGHSLNRKGEAPLKTLRRFCRRHLADAFNTIHILPFFPFSSDDGFSVIDYTQVDPSLGTWEDLEAIGQDFRLMYDFVVNHVSARSSWVESYLKGEDEIVHQSKVLSDGFEVFLYPG